MAVLFWLLLALICSAPTCCKKSSKKVNILLILADDLGFGDTSVFPFTGTGVSTPELEKMAAKGLVMTNFHSAAATCTPTRASILTGMYPWRLGIKGVYEYGEKSPKGNRDDWLPHVPTMPMLFRSHNYATYHSGKWHVGGMRNDDLDMRTSPGIDATGGSKRCLHPGPNQQGFDQYVSVLDGPGSPRQNQFQVSNTLHSQGCKMLIQNDVHIGGQGGTSDELLSDCEVRHGIRMMTESTRKNEPFYLEVWFHAPHGPWEYLSGPWDSIYDSRKVHPGRHLRMNQYRSMVSAMDRSIGKLLNAVHDLGIEENTLIVFTSDNGPEDGAGKTAGLRGNKRFIYEGGIRVPTLVQWVGHIPAGSNISTFAVSTDLLPTFAEAAGLIVPPQMHLDGISLLPQLLSASKSVYSGSNRDNITHTHHHPVPRFSVSNSDTSSSNVLSNAISLLNGQSTHLPEYLAIDPLDRIAFWHNDWEGPRLTAAWLFDFKLFISDQELPLELFDMRADPFETNNLLTKELLQQFNNITHIPTDQQSVHIVKASNNHHTQGHHSHQMKQDRDRGRHMGTHTKPSIVHTKSHGGHKTHTKESGTRALLSNSDSYSRADISHHTNNHQNIDFINDRTNPNLHLKLLIKMFRLLENFARHGNEAHQIYLSDNLHRQYPPTVESDIRSCCHNVYKSVSRDEAKILRENLLSGKSSSMCRTSTCVCAVPYVHQVPEYPFNKTEHLMKSMWPGNYPLVSNILFDSD